MRPGPVVLLVVALVAAALLPGMALADEGHGGEHGSDGPADPLQKSVALYLDAAGALAPEPASAGTVPAGPYLPGGNATPVAWAVEATKNTLLDSSVYVELYAKADRLTIVSGGPEGAAFELRLTKNGQPVEGASTLVKVESGVLQPAQELRLKAFLPQAELSLAPGDTLGFEALFFGLNPEGQPTLSYVLGGAQGSRLQFRLRYPSLAEVGVPREVGSWPVAPLEGFDFEAAKKRDPQAKVFTLRAYQFGFRPAPVVVPNGSKVVLHLYVDETLSTSSEGHAGHGHADANLTWDQNALTPLHGFSLPTLDPRLSTVLFDNLVVTLSFTADKPGNHTFLCTVFCGSGHGAMLNTLTIEGPPPPAEEVQLGPQQGSEPTARLPGFEVLAALAGAGAAAVAARRRR